MEAVPTIPLFSQYFNVRFSMLKRTGLDYLFLDNNAFQIGTLRTVTHHLSYKLVCTLY